MIKHILRWFGVGVVQRQQQEGERCATCRHFADHADPDDDPREVNGYCCHPDHFNRWKSAHYEYGGHWTHSDEWCSWWQGQ